VVSGGCRLASAGRTRAEAIARALVLDGSSSEAYAVLGNISMVYDWDWTASERAVKRSIDLAPGNMRAHLLLSVLFQVLRRFPEAVAEAVVQQRLDPASSLTSSALGRAQYRAGQFDAAIGALNQAIVLDRTYGPNYALREDPRFQDLLRRMHFPSEPR